MYEHRIGLIVPSSNTTMEMELYRVLPNGISLHTSRMPLTGVTKEELIKMNVLAVESAKLLKDAKVDLILYGCTSGSFIGGMIWIFIIMVILTPVALKFCTK